MKRSLFSVLALLFMLSMILVGCGSAETGVLLEEGVLTYAMSGEYHPFNYKDENTGELAGFDVEIGEAIAEYHGWEPVPYATPFSGIVSGLNSGKYDAIIGSMGITPDRAKEVDFSDPYYLSGAQLFVPEGSDIESLEQMNDDHVIGVALGTSYEPVAREYTSQVSTYESDVTALRDLSVSENLDAVITDRLVGLIAIEETGFEIEMAGDLIYEEQMAIAVQKGNEELLDAINEALAEIRENGTYVNISDRYFGTDIGPQGE
ncbi:transporter substrate-binding domain-containing protein [Caldalkalibacillus salinus]|uniref:transporter substrate-binding domain-containing protein n=1 Tax=Caldalkalibacillus salinus TaxID=2803787 RepID=UPI00192139F4|nr:transporter substrate-binding domain-containing protein [Caldalkalibacillus salinus]